MPDTDPLLTSTQAGAILNRSGRTVNRLAEAGKLPVAQKLPGPNGALLFRTSDVERLLAAEKASAA